jgi:diguanylate cyclase (GGDEF)-like protein
LVVSRSIRLSLWVVWALMLPSSIWLTYQFSPPASSIPEIDLITFLILMCVVSALPIVVNDITVFFTNGVSLAVFIVFGLYTELIFMQIALIVLLLKMHVSKHDLFRIPLNSVMFLSISIIGANVYYALGGKNGIFELNSFATFVPIFGYVFTVFFVNQLFIHYFRKYIYKRPEKFFSKDLIWEALTSLFVVPVGFVLYLLYSEIGVIGIVFVGIPFVSLAIILKLYYSSQKINTYLQNVSEIGHQLTERLEVDEILTLFIAKLSNMLKVEFAFIIDVNENKEFELLRYYEHGEEMDRSTITIPRDAGIIRYACDQQKPLLYKKRSEWAHISRGFLHESVESVISVPIIRNQLVVGVITLASTQKRAYEQFQSMIVDILVNYLAVAIDNAKHYEATKKISERCALTSLYNYRYFENKLEEEFKKITEVPSVLSLILLDIDHFKSVNDSYGHQAGNEILKQLADRLSNTIGTKGTVARYGGEEFVILLPNIDKFTCFRIAESIRLNISNTPFLIQNQLLEMKEKVNVSITASIGIAVAPEDGDEPMALIRHADRALYTGAKQKGRNKVAQYVK